MGSYFFLFNIIVALLLARYFANLEVSNNEKNKEKNEKKRVFK